MTEAWRNDAACRGRDSNVWYPDNRIGLRDAMRICAVCTVKDECLEFALEAEEIHGVWGGKTETERRLLLRRRRKDARRLTVAS
jgi:WhiB family redox-sensing transcriptional regulator